MPRSVSPSFIILILLLVSATSCTTNTPAPTAPPTSVSTVISSSPTKETLPTPSIIPVPVSPSEGWKTYSNSEYSFSISYPAHLEITPGKNTPTLYIGEQIHVWISDVNPLDCRGDCPLVESTEPATIADIEATKVAGYIGAVGGMIPQRYIAYILQRDSRYYSFTLYALSFNAKNECCDTIWPLDENDIVLFEEILETFKFTN